MSAGPKASPDKSAPESAQANTVTRNAGGRKQAAPKTGAANKTDAAGLRPAVAQGAYYRQGVLVPGGPPNRIASRGRNR